MASSQVLRISSIKLENASGVKSLELTVGGQQRKVFQESGHGTVIQTNFNPALEAMSQDPISVLIKYRASFSEAFLQKIIEIPINPRDVLSQTSNDNKFRYQLSSKPGFVLEIATQNDTKGASKDFEQLEVELQQAHAHIETEVAARQILEQQNVELMQKLEKRQHEESREMTEQAKMADTLQQELAQVRALAEEVKAQEAQNTVKIAQLSEEHTTTVRNLEATQSRREDLEAQLRLARAGNEEVTKMLETERLLQAQATEHGRILQQRVSEVDGQRTALELQLSMCRAERDDVMRQLKDAQCNAELADVDARKARKELTEVEHELKEAKETESSLRNLLETSSSQSDCEQRLEDLTCKLREVQSSAELAKAEAADLREGLQRTEHIERSLRADLVASRASQSDSERRIEEITRRLTDAQTSIELANTDASTAREELEMMKQIERSLRDDLKASRVSQLDTERRLEEITTQLTETQANAEVVSNEALGLKEELRKATDELTSVKDVESSLRVDFEAARASHLDAEKRLKDAHSSATSVREGLQRVEDTLADAKRIEQSLREELRASRVSQSEAEQRLDDVTQHLKRVQSDANTNVEGVKEEMRRVEQELHAARTVERSLREDLKNAQSSAEAEVNMREKLHQMEHGLKEAKRIEGMLRDNLVLTGRIAQSDFEQRFEERNQLVAQLLDIAVAFWNTHHKALRKFQSMTTPSNTKEGQADNMGEAVSSPPVAQEPPPIDTDDVTSALETLREFDHDGFLDRVSEVGSVIRKWQKQCKIYRERAKGKITFRNFSQGDLALFLPTRNTPSKPWAAFNISFPHYFLQATGDLAEQLKHREWIVARMATITERVVSQDDPSSLHYGLDDGIKYYMIEVEDWDPRTTKSKKQNGNPREISPVPDAEFSA